jgi:acyl-CoA thioester hydrolase
MPLTADIELEVPFHHVDPMEVAWHGRYLEYLEAARCALLRRIGLDYPDMRASGYAWPIVECRLKYVRPARYGDRLRVVATLVEFENRLKIDYLINDARTGCRLTKAHTLQVAVHMASGELQFVSPFILIEKVRRACEENS